MSILYRIRANYTGIPGLPGLSQFYVHAEGSPGEEASADSVLDFFGAIEGSLSDQLTIFVDGNVDHVDSTTGDTVSVVNSGGGGTQTGANSADLLPTATQLLVQWRTAVFFGGRELRGRTFIPGWCVTENDGGVPSAGAISLVHGAATTLFGDINQCVYSPTKHEFADVNSATVWGEWSVLRSRRD